MEKATPILEQLVKQDKIYQSYQNSARYFSAEFQEQYATNLNIMELYTNLYNDLLTNKKEALILNHYQKEKHVLSLAASLVNTDEQFKKSIAIDDSNTQNIQELITTGEVGKQKKICCPAKSLLHNWINTNIMPCNIISIYYPQKIIGRTLSQMLLTIIYLHSIC